MNMPHGQLDDIDADRRIRAMERDILRALVGNLSFEALGNYICRRIEASAPGVLVSVCCIADGRMLPWAAPGFPAEYGAFFQDMEIGEGVASCGTAAYRGVPVTVDDIATDPLWGPYKHVMLPHGFRACWTFPVKRRDGSVAATFAFYFKQGGGPGLYLKRLAEAGVDMCVLAIEREEHRRQISRLARFDPLTGLPNRAHMMRHLDARLAESALRDVAVIMLNLDRFRDINEALGHVAGDAVLVAIATRLDACLVSGEFLARVQSDQFVIVAAAGEEQARQLARRLLEAVSQPLEIDGYTLSLSASVGISRHAEEGQDRDALLAHARSAMERAEGKGGGAVELHASETNSAARERLLLGAALKRAIAESRLCLHYQPQVRADSDAVHGLEALARWHDPEFGHVSPGRFIPLAEKTGQIEAFSRWALREACRQMAAWRAQGLRVPSVSVNLSPVNFRTAGLPAYVAGLLREFSLPGTSLTIEITESTMIALTPKMQEVVNAIRALGVGLAVDDFGTGYSSLSNLVRLPVTEVKIDKSFIDRSLEESRLRATVAAVIGLGGELGLTVVAEGVETPAQRELLRQYHCPVIQGYLYSRPMPPDAAGAWLAEQGRKGHA